MKLYEWDAPSLFICSPTPPPSFILPLPIPLPSFFSLHPTLPLLGCFFPGIQTPCFEGTLTTEETGHEGYVLADYPNQGLICRPASNTGHPKSSFNSF